MVEKRRRGLFSVEMDYSKFHAWLDCMPANVTCKWS